MKSPHYFIVRPHQGVRYNASKNLNGKDFIMSSSQEDHRYTNRIGVVVATPIGYKGEISNGDLVVVHHNVFRLYYDMKGNERSSWNHFRDDIFMIESDQLYLYKKEFSVEWSAPRPYCFVRPILHNNEDGTISTVNVESELKGVIEYIPEGEDIKVGDIVSFKPESEYEFNIDETKLYRMKLSSLCLKI